MTALQQTTSLRSSRLSDQLKGSTNANHSAPKPTARFWDRIAKRYEKSPIADQESYERKLKLTQERFTPDMRVLEFGCGTGSTAILHAPHVREILAVDISGNMIEIAKGKAAQAGVSNVTFERATLDTVSLPEESLDAVLGLSILHLLEDKEDAIAKAYSLLKPGGMFVTSTACLADWMNWFRFIAPLGRMVGLLPLVRIFTGDQLVEAMVAQGFEIEFKWQPGTRKALFIIARKPVS